MVEAGDDTTLSSARAHALLDILSHAETCAEIEKFNHDGAIAGYGPPFSPTDTPSTSPLLQSLLSRFGLTLPGLRDVSTSFWRERVQPLVDKFGSVDLSDSYDKGAIGARRTLGTAFATLFEYPIRGIFGGLRKREVERDEKDYDPSKIEDVLASWPDFVQRLVHGGMIDELFDEVARAPNLEEHSGLIQTVHEYVLINVAATMHYTMVLSPDGQYLTRTIGNIHTLVPYGIIRQTLRVGNAATMIHAMMRLVLAKISVTGLTNWIGLTNSTHDGMNLLQQIISTAIGWDIAEMQKQITRLKEGKHAPSKKHLDAIKQYVQDHDREKQQLLRKTSEIERRSIVSVVLASVAPDLPALSDEEHAVALDYLSVQLSIRDRQQMDYVLCRHHPDLVTQAIKDVVTAYDPIIRGVHNASDLSSSMGDFQEFMDDFVKLAKRPYTGKRSLRNPAGVSVSTGTTKGTDSAYNSDAEGPVREKEKHHHHRPHIHRHHREKEISDDALLQHKRSQQSLRSQKSLQPEDKPDVPSVEDYVALVRKHVPAAHRFLHEVAKNGKEVTQWYRDWAKEAVSNFRLDTHPTADDVAATTSPSPPTTAGAVGDGGAGNLTPALSSLFRELPAEDRARTARSLDAHAEYLDALRTASRSRLRAILAATSAAGVGPGMYLSRWQDHLDRTPITPDEQHEESPRTGRSLLHAQVAMDALDIGEVRHVDGRRGRLLEAPDVDRVVELLRPGFVDVVKSIGLVHSKAREDGGGGGGEDDDAEGEKETDQSPASATPAE